MYSEKHDFEKYAGEPNKVICVYFVPRSGSTFLANEMHKTEKLGFPLEYFSRDHVIEISKRVDGFSRQNNLDLVCLRTSQNGVFSFKWNCNFGPTVLESDYNIFIDRRDIAAQAKSFVTASKNGSWLGGGNYNATQAEISHAMLFLDDIRERTKKMIAGNFMTVMFEDLIENPETTINNILEYVGETEEPIELTEEETGRIYETDNES